jgi:hypothetical protein
MEPIGSSEKNLNLHQAIRRNILEEDNLQMMNRIHTAGNHERNKHILVGR